MSYFLTGLRTALTRATSYGSATSAQSPQEGAEVNGENEVSGEDGRHTKTPRKDPFVDEDSYINLDASQIEAPEDVRSSDESQAASSCTLSIDEETGLNKNTDQENGLNRNTDQENGLNKNTDQETVLNRNNNPDPATPLQSGSVGTPKTIFQTAQKDLFKTAFKSAAKERDIFMTAKPIRTWNAVSAEDHDASPTGSGSVDDSSVTLSLDQTSNTFENTPSVSSKRDREEDQDSFVHITSTTSPKRRRRTLSPETKAQSTVAYRPSDADADEELEDSSRYISELDTSGLSDDDNSGLSSSESWALDSPPPGLDRKGRRNWKRQQRRLISKSLEQTYGTKKPRVGKRPSRSGFRRSVSGRDILIGHARRRFWEGKVVKDVYCY